MDLGIKMGFVWECGGGNSKKPESRRRSMMIFPLQSCFSKWGAAFCIEGGPEKERQAMEYLERRESEYDLKARVDFYSEDDPLKPAVTGCLVFTSTLSKISNKYYLGPAGLEDMASQIATATGPCGNNRDYLFKLEKALADIEHGDEEEFVA